MRRSHDRAKDKQAIHLVRAWASENYLVLGHVKVHDKSNEITAIPELLRVLELKGCLVTIDAMGCQRDIAKLIVDAGGPTTCWPSKATRKPWQKTSSGSSRAPKPKTLRTWIICISRPWRKGTGVSKNVRIGRPTTSGA